MMRPAVPVIDRYLARELVSPFFFGGALFSFFLVIDRIYHLTDLVITKGVPFYLVVQLLVFMLPQFLAHTLPMALLVAVLLAGGRLAGDLEITAFKAAGVSPLRLFRPVFAWALLVATVTATLTLVINPLANGVFQRQLFRILQARAVSGLSERVFNATFGDVIIYTEDVSASQVALRGLLVSDERDPKVSRIITAREGRLLTDEENRRITLRLINGAVSEADVLPAVPPAVRSGITGGGGGAASAARYRLTNFSIYDMSLSVDSPLKSTSKTEKPEKDLSLPDLTARITALGKEPALLTPFLVEWHKRFALPVAALVFTLVAFPLAIRSHRGGRSIALVASLAILVSYYLVLSSLENSALRQRLPVWLAIWTPNLLFCGIGSTLLIATTLEWRAPRLRLLWQAVETVRQSLPERRQIGIRVMAGARESTHILDRYLVREYLVLMGIGLAVAATLFVVIDLLQTLDRFIRIKPPLLYVLEHFLYRVPAALHDGLPVVTLVATIFLFLALARYHELTAMKAAGMSLYRVALPVLLVGLGVAVVSGLFQEILLPRLNELGDEVDRVKIRGQLPRHLQSRERLWLRASDTRFYRVELLAPGTGDMYGMTVLEVDPTFRLLSRLDARRAHVSAEGWELTDGAFREFGPKGEVSTIPFAMTALDMQEDLEDFTKIHKPIAAMSYWELRDYINRLEATGFQVKKYLVELYSKLSFPLVNMIMVLVAIPFSLQAPRGGRLFGVGLAIAIMAGYLVVHYIALAFARADLLPPLLAAWTANIIFLGLGTSLFLRART